MFYTCMYSKRCWFPWLLSLALHETPFEMPGTSDILCIPPIKGTMDGFQWECVSKPLKWFFSNKGIPVSLCDAVSTDETSGVILFHSVMRTILCGVG